MGQALAGFTIFLIIAGGIMITLTRRTRDRMRDAIAAEEGLPIPPKLSRRQQAIAAATAAAEPAIPVVSIEELVAQEAKETGVNDIPGGDGLDVSLKLRVYWRDEVVRTGCADGRLEFRLGEGVTAENAATEDVRLVCVRGDREVEAPESTPPPGDGESS